MALPPLVELRGSLRDGTAQGERRRAEVADGAIGLDERTPAELLRFVRRFATSLYWHGPGNLPAGWWANPEEAPDRDAPPRPRAFFDGLGPDGIGWDEVAAFAADPAAFPGDRFALLRRPHMALLLTAVRLLRHGQRAVNGVVGRHLDWHLRDLLGLAPRPAVPDRAFVVFDLAPNIAAAEVPTGLRLLAGRDARRRDRVYTVDDGLVVNRTRIARISSTFVDRDIIGLADARHAITGTPDELNLFLLGIALGDPRPGDPLPPLRGSPLTTARLADVATLIAFPPTGLFMDLYELRALLARKARRANEAADWTRINRFIESAGQTKRKDQSWALNPKDPTDFTGNLFNALQGDPGIDQLADVKTVDDLLLHLDRPEVVAAITDKLCLPVGRFTTMMGIKRGIDADWAVINAYLDRAGRRKRPTDPNWHLTVASQADFAANLAAAIGPVDYTAAGPEAAGVTDIDALLARIVEIETYFFMPAEDVARLIATFAVKDTDSGGAAAWKAVYDRLAGAYAAKMRAAATAALAAARTNAPRGTDGLAAELAATLGDLSPGADPIAALARYAPADDVAIIANLLGATRRPGVDWSSVDTILAAAQQRRLRLPAPVAEKRHWRALFAYDDAKTAAVGATGAWRAFGGLPAAMGPATPPAAIGWALASPMLDVSTGRRQIVVTLGFADDGGGALVAAPDDHGDSPAKLPFDVTLSGPKGWFVPTGATFAQVDYKSVQGVAAVDAQTKLIALQVTLLLDETAPATAPPAGAFGDTAWPVLRLMLRPVWDDARGHFDTAYERFHGLRLLRVNVATTNGAFVADGAPGLWPLAVETEAGVANGKKPFEPFGPVPSVGSELALGHRDLLHKNLSVVVLHLDWLGGPTDLAAWYKTYGLSGSFGAQLSVVDNVRTTDLPPGALLFAGVDSTAPQSIARATAAAAPPDPVPSPAVAEVRGWRRYLTLRLGGTDFGHHVYPGLASAKAIALADKLRAGGSAADAAFNPANYVVNPPYTPKLKRISLDFAAQQEIDLTRYDPAGIDRLYHVDAFGIDAASPAAGGWPFLPDHDEQGALYLGLAGVAAPQSLSLLFAATATGGAADRAGPVTWSYLDAGGWTRFATPPDDATDGLTRRGLIRFALPAADPDARMPSGLYWLRATADWGADNAADLIDIHAHAAAATFVDDDAPPDHYLAPLPPKSIRALGDAVAGIARVTQPYSSSDGAPAEDDDTFRTRAGERLRHKNRALTVWDYERLVLAAFPAVHKVKCLPAGLADGLGTVRIVVIPDLRSEPRADPFTPRAPARLLDAIAAYLAPLTPATATVAVGNASFVRVRVRVGVRFRPGGDEAFDKTRLAERLNHYLAPWAYDEGVDIAIGQRINATSIVAFIDRLPFVDFVGGCRLFASIDGGRTWRPDDVDDGDSVGAASEDGVLVPATDHEIDVIDDDVFEQQNFTGIGYMKIELDFVVGETR